MIFGEQMSSGDRNSSVWKNFSLERSLEKGLQESVAAPTLGHPGDGMNSQVC